MGAKPVKERPKVGVLLSERDLEQSQNEDSDEELLVTPPGHITGVCFICSIIFSKQFSNWSDCVRLRQALQQLCQIKLGVYGTKSIHMPVPYYQ